MTNFFFFFLVSFFAGMPLLDGCFSYKPNSLVMGWHVCLVSKEQLLTRTTMFSFILV